jgi:hypothetical protein
MSVEHIQSRVTILIANYSEILDIAMVRPCPERHKCPSS